MSDVPDEREQRWDRALVEAAKMLVRGRPDSAAPLMAEADAEVAAERQRLHDLEARIEALCADMDERGRPGASDSPFDTASRRQIREDVKRIRSALASEASASSPVSDDTGATKP